jgi:hypothetical protein
VFENYRRGNQAFSVRSAYSRTLGRYNEKVRDGAKGLGLLVNVYKDLADTPDPDFSGTSFSSLWGYASVNFFADQVLASGKAFDHFTRMMARPQAGPHCVVNDGIRAEEPDDCPGQYCCAGDNTDLDADLYIPDGATAYFGDVSFGGKLVENRLAEDQGEFESDYTINAGSYYDKYTAPYLLAESEDNFISDSRDDFVDGRYRAVSMADVFPDGYRRWLANNLTLDDQVRGVRLAADDDQNPMVGDDRFPTWPIGTVSWWPADGPEVCFPAEGTSICSSLIGGDFGNTDAPNTLTLDPQIGFEQQKFLITQTFQYLPDNQKFFWRDMLELWRVGPIETSDLPNRIELHNPQGDRYVAKTFGTEILFGKTVQKGVAARVLEYGNELLAQAYEVTAIDYNNDTVIDWYEPVLNSNGQPIVKYDPTLSNVFGQPNQSTFCNAQTNEGCVCEDNHACLRLQKYVSVAEFLSQMWWRYNVDLKGVY